MLRISARLQWRLPSTRSLASTIRTCAHTVGNSSSIHTAALDASHEQLPSSSQQQQLPSQVYDALVAQQALTPDRAQADVLRKYLDKLHRQLDNYTLPELSQHPSPPVATAAATDNDSPSNNTNESSPSSHTNRSNESVLVPRGLYLHGSVGTGKSMLMDLFFATVTTPHKRRVHFHTFMLDVHQRIQRHKQAQLARYGRQRHIVVDPRRDAIALVADEIACEAHVLCFDEFQVTDIADALIMRTLFNVFFRRGVVVVATSNTPPQQLYRDGTNREYFVPFLQQLARHTRVVALPSSIDYRRQSALATTASTSSINRSPLFLSPLTAATHAALDAHYNDLLLLDRRDDCRDDDRSGTSTLRVPVMMGRTLDVRGSRNGVARASFALLCGTEKGAADYKALCECFISSLRSLRLLSLAFSCSLLRSVYAYATAACSRVGSSAYTSSLHPPLSPRARRSLTIAAPHARARAGPDPDTRAARRRAAVHCAP